MRSITALFLSLAVTPVLAHPGDHTGFSTVAFGWHVLLEPDHLFFAALTVAVGVVAYRIGKRAGHKEARVETKK